MPLVYPFDFAQEILNIPQEYDEDFIRALIERTFTQFSNSRIRSAGAYTFAGCSRLSVVDLPNLVSFAEHQFQSCIALREVTFPNVMYGASAVFSDCYNLEYVEIPAYINKWSSYGSMSSWYAIPSYMFYRCSNLINVEGIKYESIQYIGPYAFMSCSVFSRINEFIHLKGMGTSAFGSCQNLYYVDFQELSYVPYGAFTGCRNISWANLPVASYLEYMAFSGCSSLTSISIPNVSYIGMYAFAYCRDLPTLSAPQCKSMSQGAFQNCPNLEYIYMPLCSKLSNNSISIYTYGSYFYNCSKLSHIDADPLLFYSIVPNNTFQNCQLLQFDNFIFDGCSHVGSYAFASCLQLTSFYAPSCSTIFTAAFSGCTNLSSIVLNNMAISSISDYTFQKTAISTANYPNCNTVAYGAFQYCPSLNTVSLTNCSLISNYAFCSCSTLESVYIPKCTIVSYGAFQSCSALSNIDLPSCKTLGGYAFYGCYNLTEISIPIASEFSAYTFAFCSQLTSFYAPQCTKLNGTSTFYQCANLSIVNLPMCSSIGSGAFCYCRQLTNVSIPQCTELLSQTFSGCNAGLSLYAPMCKSISANALPSYMKSITLSTSYSIVLSSTFRYYSNSYLALPGVKAIYSYGFQYGSGLQTISLQQCSILSRMAFYYCTGLRSVYLMYPACVSIASWPEQIFYSCSYSQITFYVPTSLVSSYKTHPYWAQVESHFVGV